MVMVGTCCPARINPPQIERLKITCHGSLNIRVVITGMWSPCGSHEYNISHCTPYPYRVDQVLAEAVSCFKKTKTLYKDTDDPILRFLPSNCTEHWINP